MSKHMTCFLTEMRKMSERKDTFVFLFIHLYSGLTAAFIHTFLRTYIQIPIGTPNNDMRIAGKFS